jgi:hypothetical protein
MGLPGAQSIGMQTIDPIAPGGRPGTALTGPWAIDAGDVAPAGSSTRAGRGGRMVDPLSRRAWGGHSGRIGQAGV